MSRYKEYTNIDDIPDDIINQERYIYVKFKTIQDLENFNEISGLNIGLKTKVITYTKKDNRLDKFIAN